MKVIKVGEEGITFEDGSILSSAHEQSCCESHYLDFTHLTVDDFTGLEFEPHNLGKMVERIKNYGIALHPSSLGHPVRIPGYGTNNGCYSCDLDLVLTSRRGDSMAILDITDCQKIN